MQLLVTGTVCLYNGVTFEAVLYVEVTHENATIGRIVQVSDCDGYSQDFPGKLINLANGVIYMPGENATFTENAHQPADPD